MGKKTRDELVEEAWVEILKIVPPQGMHRDELLRRLTEQDFPVEVIQLALWKLLDAGYLDYTGVSDVEATERTPVDA